MKTLADVSIDLLHENLQANTDNNDKLIEDACWDTYNDQANTSLYSSSSSTSSVPAVKESPPLRRTQAIPDLHIMDDFSPVTFETQLNLKPDDNTISEDQSKVDYIEENKVIIPGIKVRAAKLPKLIQILVESFGNYILV
jgi:hypothetical protein